MSSKTSFLKTLSFSTSLFTFKSTIFSFFLLLSILSANAAQEWSKVDPDFASAYELSQEILDQAVAQARDQGRTLRTGAIRALQFEDNWKKVSLSEKLHYYFGNDELKYKARRRGKVYIQLIDMEKGQEYIRIVFDASGDYYRIEQGVFDGVKINTPSSPYARYLNVYAEDLERPDHLSGPQWRNFFNEATHFKATP